MKKSILIALITAGLLLIVGGTTVGLVYSLSSSEGGTLVVESVTTEPDFDQITFEIKCEDDQTDQQHQNQNQNGFRRMFAYMHQIQFINCDTGETMYQEQLQNQWRNRVQAGESRMYQFQIEELEQGQMLQLRISYNNGETLMYQFQVKN
ncbi:MAG: hypothetical protein FK730_06090 [Asgard group archaeon]|nr:hypothetical protein [Asgard group archaeon]